MKNKKMVKAKADTKKAIPDIGNKMEHAKPDLTADAKKVKAKVGHGK